ASNRGRSDLSLNLGPERKLVIRTARPAGRLVGRIYSRHPDDLVAGAARDFERDRVQPANAVIKRNRSVGHNTGYGAGHDLCAFCSWNIVRFQYETAQADG